MKQSMKGAAKRLTFSLVVVSALGGCAVYGPADPGPYAYGTYATGQPVYVAPPVYANPYPYPYLYPYPYYYDPLYIGPAVSFNFGFSSWSGHRGHDRGFRGGHGGFRGSHGGGSRRGDR